MARRNRGGPSAGEDFPYESLAFDSLPQHLIEAGYGWKWWSPKDPNRPKMRAFRIDDPDLDANGEKHLVQCGKLMQLRLRVPHSSGQGYKAAKFSLPPALSRWCYLMFDVRDPSERLYSVLSDNAKRYLAEHMYATSPFRDVPLKQVAKWTGGRHAAGWYADVLVRPVGLGAAVMYEGDKRADGRSNYIHRFGEETGIRPMVCVDRTGRIWFAGGDYTCPTAGITN